MSKTFVVVALWAQALFLSVDIYGAVSAGSKVTLKFPKKMLGVVATSGWSGNQYGVEVECDDSGCALNGQKDWKTLGFPWLVDGVVGKTFVDKKTKKTVVDVKTDVGANVRIVFPNPADVDKGMTAVTLLPGESREGYRAEMYKTIAKSVFTGDLAGVPEDTQSRLLAFADAVGSPLSTTKYKSGSYISIDVGDDGNVYNTLQMNQVQRVARSLREHIVPALKRLASDVSASSMTGVKIAFKVNFKNFLEKYASSSLDSVVMYVPAEALKQFADADISSQKLMDASVILVNGDRIEVSLSE
ncbi:MAG: hypothetical protein JJE51_13795 [Thermoanaerobaculia bacterium]|nr:hypothetical protein [Thermoanaerobaculia bacterium]